MVRQLLVVAILFTFVLMATPAMADCTIHKVKVKVSDNDIVMVGENLATGKITTVYVVTEDPEPCDDCEAAEEPKFTIQSSGFFHGDIVYPQGGPEETYLDRMRSNTNFQYGDNWSGRYRFDYRNHTGRIDLQQLYVKYKGDGWWTAFGPRVFFFAATPPPDGNRWNGYSENLAGIVEAPGIVVGTSCGDFDVSAAWLADSDKVRGRYDGFALTSSTTLGNGVYMAALGYGTGDSGKEVWGFDTIIPLGGGSEFQFTTAGNEGVDKAHGWYVGGSFSLDSEGLWYFNLNHDQGWKGGIPYETLAGSINRNFGNGVMVTAEHREDMILNGETSSFRLEVPVSFFGL